MQASIEVLRMLEIPEVFHYFAPIDYVELFAAATVRFVCFFLEENYLCN
jgi:hypothetical protein